MQILQDPNLSVTSALPNGAATVTSPAIDTETSTPMGDDAAGQLEFLLSAPALTTSQLGNAATVTYNIFWSANANLSSPVEYIAGAIVQTGAGGVGAAAASFRFRPPSTGGRYWYFTAVNSASGNASGVSATLVAEL